MDKIESLCSDLLDHWPVLVSVVTIVNGTQGHCELNVLRPKWDVLAQRCHRLVRTQVFQVLEGSGMS